MRFLLLAFALTAAADAQAHLQPMSSADLHTLAPQLTLKLLPSRAESLHLEPKQAFILKSPGSPALSIVPAYFDLPGTEGPGNIYTCGVFLAPAGGSVSFVPIYNLTPDTMGECTSTAAVGLMTDDGPHPRILLVLNAYEPPRHSWQQPAVLIWTGSTYKVDTTFSPDTDDLPARVTIAEIRQRLTPKK